MNSYDNTKPNQIALYAIYIESFTVEIGLPTFTDIIHH